MEERVRLRVRGWWAWQRGEGGGMKAYKQGEEEERVRLRVRSRWEWQGAAISLLAEQERWLGWWEWQWAGPWIDDDAGGLSGSWW